MYNLYNSGSFVFSKFDKILFFSNCNNLTRAKLYVLDV